MSSIGNNIIFSLNFLRHPLRNASLVPSSAFASKTMLDGIDLSVIDSVVELGPGTGALTGEILKRCKRGATVLLLEVEKSYVTILRKRFGDSIIIECASAHLLDEILAKHCIEKVSLIISGLPVSLPEPVKAGLLRSIKAHTEQGTIFRFFTYNPPMMKRAYKSLPVRKIAFVLKNFPPLWVYGIN